MNCANCEEPVKCAAQLRARHQRTLRRLLREDDDDDPSLGHLRSWPEGRHRGYGRLHR